MYLFTPLFVVGFIGDVQHIEPDFFIGMCWIVFDAVHDHALKIEDHFMYNPRTRIVKITAIHKILVAYSACRAEIRKPCAKGHCSGY